jgi:hypothetical protein
MGGLGLILLTLFAAIPLWPKKRVDLRHFQSEELAVREAAAWRAYYEERYAALVVQVFQAAHAGYGFSLKESLRLSFHAVRGAAHFRRSNADQDISTSLREMEAYYLIVSENSLHPFDFHQAAALELQWWKMRREKRPEEEWAQTIARQCQVVYGMPAEVFLPSVRIRTSAMALRDSKRKTKMSEQDWQTIRDELRESARQFWNVLNQPVASTAGEALNSPKMPECNSEGAAL